MIGKHALRNSIIPVVTYIGVSLGVLFGGALITETIFQYNGVGYLLSGPSPGTTCPIIAAVVIFAVMAFVVLRCIVDILYALARSADRLRAASRRSPPPPRQEAIPR